MGCLESIPETIRGVRADVVSIVCPMHDIVVVDVEAGMNASRWR
jgi:hypothetical protein